jgi:hypothetical protein
MSDSACGKCASSVDADDRFCRQCGSPALHSRVPALASTGSVTTWRPQASPLVKGAAVMAAGTIGQFMLRRVVGGLITRPTRRRRLLPSFEGNDGLADEAQVITETVTLRRVRVRRRT